MAPVFTGYVIGDLLNLNLKKKNHFYTKGEDSDPNY